MPIHCWFSEKLLFCRFRSSPICCEFQFLLYRKIFEVICQHNAIANENDGEKNRRGSKLESWEIVWKIRAIEFNSLSYFLVLSAPTSKSSFYLILSSISFWLFIGRTGDLKEDTTEVVSHTYAYLSHLEYKQWISMNSKSY